MVAFARSISSSISLNLMMLWTGPEDLLLGYLHVVLNITKDSGSHEIAAIADPLASGHQLGALILAGFDEAHYLVELVEIYLRPLLRTWVKRVADRPAFGAFGAALDEPRRRSYPARRRASPRNSIGPG